MGDQEHARRSKMPRQAKPMVGRPTIVMADHPLASRRLRRLQERLDRENAAQSAAAEAKRPHRQPWEDEAQLSERLMLLEADWYVRSYQLPHDERAPLVARVLRAACVAIEGDLNVLTKQARVADRFAEKHGAKSLPLSNPRTAEALVERVARWIDDPRARPYAHFRFVEGVLGGSRYGRELLRAGVQVDTVTQAGRVEQAWAPILARAQREAEPSDPSKLVRVGLEVMGLKADVFAAKRKQQSRSTKKRQRASQQKRKRS